MASSNIIGASFEDYVKKQIRVRQEKLGLSLKDQEVYNFTNSNAPFIRLTSGVNVDASVLTQLGLQNNSLYSGNGLATYNKLYGGRSLYIKSLNTSDPNNVKFDALTKGYGYYDGSIGQYPTSYGFYSDADYGLVPPPGIKSIDVKAMNRGSLREATIQIQCHSLQQFKIIEILYMRLKYSILLEWGHSMYFDNDGAFIPSSAWDLSYIFLKGTDTQQGILESIEKNREESNGNYDAFFGLVTNFSWTLRPDGGYDITVIARSVGDVIESLKINTNYPSVNPLNAAPDTTSLITANAEKTTINKILASITTQLYPNRGYAHGVDLNNEYRNAAEPKADTTAQTPIHNGNLEWMAGRLESAFNRTADVSKSGDYLTWNEAWMFEFEKLTGGNYLRQYYIKLGTLMRILESFLLVYDTTKGKDKVRPPLFKIDYNYNTNYCLTFPRHCSLDPKVCLIPIDKNVTGSGALSGYAFTTKTYDFMEVYDVNDNTGAIQFYSNDDLATATINLGGKWGPLVIETETTPESTEINPGSTLQAYGPRGTHTAETLHTYVEGVATTVLGSDKDAAKNNLADLYKFGDDTRKNPITVVDGQPYVLGYSLRAQDLGEKYFDYNPGNINPKDLGNRNFISPVEISKDEYYRLKGYRSVSYRNADYYAGDDLAHKRAYYRRVTVYTFSDLASNYNAGSGGSSNVYDLLKDTNFKTDGNAYRGNTMHMYVNLGCIVDILDKNVNISTGEISLYDFLDQLMKKIQNALGNINNFQIIYNEDTNSYRIIDNTFIPGTIGKTDRFKIASFNANILKPNYGSFIENVNFKSKLSNNFATMTTIGAQKNGNVVGSNSTALSKWNNGLTDRIIEKKANTNANTDGGNIETIYTQNIIYLKEFNRKVNEKKVSDQDISSIKGAIGDIFNAQIGEYTNDPKANFPGIGFIPFDLELTMLGLSGPRIYESYTIDTTLLPDVYKDKVQFICSGVSHHVDENGWKTTLNSICGPRYSGVEVEQPASVDNIPAIVVPTGGGSGGGGCGTLNQTQKDNIIKIDEVLKNRGFNTVESRLAILAVVGKETRFTPRREGGYSRSTNGYILTGSGQFTGFGRRKRNGRRLDNLSSTELDTLKANDKNFFNWIYDGENSSLGLGNIPGSDDGYNYRASGFNQITGRANYQSLATFTGIDYIANPDSLNNVQGAADGAAWFFGQNNANFISKLYKEKLGGTEVNYKDATNLDAAIKAAAWLNAGGSNSLGDSAVQWSITNALGFKDCLINFYKTDSTLQGKYNY